MLDKCLVYYLLINISIIPTTGKQKKKDCEVSFIDFIHLHRFYFLSKEENKTKQNVFYSETIILFQTIWIIIAKGVKMFTRMLRI